MQTIEDLWYLSMCLYRLSVVDADDVVYRYRMDRRERGRFIIINNETFLPQTRMDQRPRTGTDIDAANLYTDFKQMGFSVEIHKNQTRKEMLGLMIKGWYYQW